MGERRYEKKEFIRIFREIKDSDGLIKQYIHPSNQMIRAHVRSLSSKEQATLGGLQDYLLVEFVINWREIKVDMFVEFDGEVFNVDSIDPYDFKKIELKFIGAKTDPKEYKETRWTS
jgi:hypothetical protein